MPSFSYIPALTLSATLFLLSACLNTTPALQTLIPMDLNPSLGLEEVTSFDVAINNGLIHLLVAGKTSGKNSPVVVRYLSSEDGGDNWIAAVDVSNKTKPIATRGNDVQIAAAKNNLVAIWQSTGDLENSGPMMNRYSHDGGKTWFTGKNPAQDNSGDQSHIDVISDKNGVFHAIWLADPEENGFQSLRYARSINAGVNWQASLKLDESTCSCCWNTLAISPAGELNVLYRDMKPRDMALMQSSDQGSTWRQASIVGDFKWQFDGCPHIGGGIAIHDNNTIYSSVWTGIEGKAGLYFLRSTDNGKTWSNPQPLGGLASHSDIAVNNQNVAAIWDEREPDGSSIFFKHSNIGTISWSTPVRLSPVGAMASHPRIVSNLDGYLVLWTEKHNKHTKLVIKRLTE